jgi:hypothetical protein
VGILLLVVLPASIFLLLELRRSETSRAALLHSAPTPSASARSARSAPRATAVATPTASGAHEIGDEPADYAKVFDPNKVHRIEIELKPADWDALQASLPRHQNLKQVFGAEFAVLQQACRGLHHYDECQVPNQPAGTLGRCRGPDDALACLNGALAHRAGSLPSPKTYVPCTIRYDDRSWTNVGFRFKGGSTFRSPLQLGTSQKLPFRLHMSRFGDHDPALHRPTFFGFRKLTFANGANDETLLRDFLSSQLYEAFGVPAPKVAFYRVFLNPGRGPFYYGLFSMIEDPDGPMLAARYKAGGGNLYKPTGDGASWRGKFEQASFPKETNSAQADWQDVERAHAALHVQVRGKPWRAELEKAFDVDLFLRWLAVTVFTSPTDTHGFGSPHNYYLYADPGDGGRLKWLPWDNDSAFKGAAHPFLDDVQEFPLIRRILDDSAYAARYKQLLKELLAGPAKPELLLAMIRAQRQRIQPYMLGPEGEQAGYTFLAGPGLTDYAFKQLEQFITARHQTLLDALK